MVRDRPGEDLFDPAVTIDRNLPPPPEPDPDRNPEPGLLPVDLPAIPDAVSDRDRAGIPAVATPAEELSHVR
jgi:hypothetical protein